MKTVRIAELKNRLSAYLRRVRRGEVLTVLDRDTPIARLEPIAPGPGGAGGATLTLRGPAPDARRPGDVRFPPPLKLRTDVLTLLALERGER